MPTVRIRASQKVHYSRTIELTEEQLECLKETARDDCDLGDLYLDPVSNWYDEENVEPDDIMVDVKDSEGEWKDAW